MNLPRLDVSPLPVDSEFEAKQEESAQVVNSSRTSSWSDEPLADHRGRGVHDARAMAMKVTHSAAHSSEQIDSLHLEMRLRHQLLQFGGTSERFH